MRELALHLLDIAHNSVSANARNITINVVEDTILDRLFMSVEDDGCGMDAETVQRVIDPFVTSRTTRTVGLGIPLLKAAAEACNGSLTIQSKLGEGTKLVVEFQRSHIDRMPLGNIEETFLSLLVGCPDVNWHFFYAVDHQVFDFHSSEVKDVLEDIPLTEPSVLSYLRNCIFDGVEQTRSAVEVY